MELKNEEMQAINGGISWGVVAGISTAIVYLIGVFSGYTNPNRCHN